jgi:hypothetical protein
MPDTSPETVALRAALEAANRRERDANARANQATQQAHTATQRGLAAELAAYDNALEQTKAAQSIARQKWTTLQQEGNFEEAATAMQEMSDASARLTQLQNQRNYVANQAEQVKNAPPQQSDPLAGYSEQEREWIRNNPKYLEDADFNQRVNAAAEYAMKIAGHTRNTPEYFESIERAIYPDRFTGSGYEGNGSPFSDTGGDRPVGEGNGMQQRHNIELPQHTPQQDVPVMRTGEERVEQPQERAVGRGGGGMSATAAPPSRRMAEAGRNVSSGRVTLTQDELDSAIRLATDIEGDKTNGWSREQFAEWYYMMAHHPSHQNTRRRSWVRDAIIA